MDKLKILLITLIYPNHYKVFRGPFVHKWAKQLEKCGCEIEVFTINSITLGTYLRSLRDVLHFYRTPKLFTYSWDGINVKGVRYHSIIPTKYYSARMAPYLSYRAIRPEITKIHACFPFNLVYLATDGALSLAMSRIVRQMHVPYIASAIGSDVNDCYQKQHSRRFRIEREIFVNSKLVVCVSEDMKRKVELMTDGSANTMTFYAGVDINKYAKNPSLRQEYRKRLSCKNNDKVILFVGNMIRAKGIYELLEVFRDLYKRNKSLHLLLVGDLVEHRKLMSIIKHHGIRSGVTLAGGVSPKEVIGWMNAADLFAFPSWAEGLPNAVMEACSCELPVVASNVGGIPELIDDGKTGILIPPRDEENLYRKIVNLIELPKLRSRLGKAAREKMEKDFDYRKNGEYLIERISKILQNGNSRK